VSAEPLCGPEPLTNEHQVSAFDCGVPSLNGYLIDQALADGRAGKSRTLVAVRSERVVAYFSLAAGSVAVADATERLARGQGRQAIPVVLLSRLAVDRSEQGRGLGSRMLLEAAARAAAAAEVIGARALLVQALDGSARSFYLKHGFEPSPKHPLQLVMLMKDIRKTLGGEPTG
jgi:GNAT superfamily N-acetyltransferase